MLKVLMIEDEANIRKFMVLNFMKEGFSVIEAESGEEAIRLARMETPDIALIDVVLPGMDGLKTSTILRNEFPTLGIIMLTSRSKDTDKIEGLQTGADDYVTKPFNITELFLRVRSLLRRLNKEESGSKEYHLIASQSFMLDTHHKNIKKDGIELDISVTEYLLLKLFIEHPGRIFSKNELLDLVWGYEYFGDPKVVEVNICRLRNKIEDPEKSEEFIETLRGRGYRWVD